jgi:hypothetical protein
VIGISCFFTAGVLDRDIRSVEGQNTMRATRVIATLFVLGVNMPAFAETAIQPLPKEECQAIAVTLTKVTGIKLNVTEGTPPIMLEGLSGKACLMNGQATGVKRDFNTIQFKVAEAFPGWTTAEYDADGAAALVRSLKLGNKRLAYRLEMEPPKGTCTENVPIVDCKVPMKRWVWTIEAAGYTR